jgi:hypothetical protein
MKRNLVVVSVCAIFGLCAAVFAEQVDNPEYAAWVKYKAGTFVTIQQSTEMPGMANMPGMEGMGNMAAMMPQTTVTTKLTEVKPEALTLELTTTTTMMGQPRENKTTRTVPAKMDVATTQPTATATAATRSAEIKDMKTGKDTVEIKGKKLETTTQEFTTTTTTGMPGMGAGRGAGRGPARGGADEAPMTAHMKVWSSPEVPNGMVKTETTTTMDPVGEVKMIQTVVDYNVVR